MKIKRTIEHLHMMFTTGTISASDFRKHFKTMGALGLLHYKYPPKNAKDIAVYDVLLDFMDRTAKSYNGF